jgi:hypothetical protein
MVEQMFDRERLGEIASGRLSGAGTVMEVHGSLDDEDLVPGTRRYVRPFGVERQVARRNRQPRFEEPLVDRPELAHGKASEVHRADHSSFALVDQHRGERRPKLVVR